MRRRARLALALLLAAAPAGAESAADRAAACWRGRADGFATTGAIDRAAARCAVESYRLAAAEAPDDLALATRRIEALWFAAHFAAGDAAERRDWLDEAVAVADRAVAEVDRRAGTAGGRWDDPRVLEALARIPEAGAVHFYAAIAWGEWGLTRGWLASAGRGVAGRLRRHAELAARLAPELRDGGGLRLLGRLHATMPRLPLVTAWVDRARGAQLLREALAVSRDEPRNLLFLAEALLDQEPAARAEAEALLVELAARQPAEDEWVEQSETLAAARDRLRRLRAPREG